MSGITLILTAMRPASARLQRLLLGTRLAQDGVGAPNLPSPAPRGGRKSRASVAAHGPSAWADARDGPGRPRRVSSQNCGKKPLGWTANACPLPIGGL